MRSLVIIAIGIGIWTALLGVMHLIKSLPIKQRKWFPIGFSMFWFIAVGTNMWIGINKAGYTFMEELPIFFLIYIPPVVAAFWSTCKLNSCNRR